MHNRKQKNSQKQREKLREAQEKKRDLYWDPTRPTKKRKTTVDKPAKTKCKADVFQRMLAGIIRIILELWLERNTDCHQPLQGQKRIAKIIEATQTVTDLYLL